MRAGQNPAKYVKTVAKPERITVAVLNYIPFVSGFYEHIPEVLKACLASLQAAVDVPFDLMVFDNGSCAEVRDLLHDEFSRGTIQYLILSEKNLGKGGAWNMIFGGAPGEIIAYTDNDVLFSKGWLSRSLELLETYPNVGMVTARPIRTDPSWNTRTVEWAEAEPTVRVERGQLVPRDILLEFDRSLGKEAEFEAFYTSTSDIRLTHRNVQAYVGASHWQFLARKDVLIRYLPFQMDRPMQQVSRLDLRMNEDGYLRLMVTDPLVANMSNTPPTLVTGTKNHKSKPNILLEFPPVKRALMGLYNRIFRWYYRQ